MSITVAIVEDDPSLRQELERVLTHSNHFKCVASCVSAEQALQVIPQTRPSVILQDLRLPGASGVACIVSLKSLLPDSQILVFSVADDYDSVFTAMAAGATGYLVKGATGPELLQAIHDLCDGGSPMSASIARMVVRAFAEQGRNTASLESLTPRETEILSLLASGFRQKEVAAKFDISSRTVAAHLRRIYTKLQVRSKSQAIGKFRIGQSHPL